VYICVGVVPDDDMGYKLIRIFGEESHVFRKYRRMMYWMPKFKFANPYYVPYVLPNDDIELAKMALNRMSVDLENKVTVHHVSDVTLFYLLSFFITAPYYCRLKAYIVLTFWAEKSNSVYVDMSRGDNAQGILGTIGPFWAKWGLGRVPQQSTSFFVW